MSIPNREEVEWRRRQWEMEMRVVSFHFIHTPGLVLSGWPQRDIQMFSSFFLCVCVGCFCCSYLYVCVFCPDTSMADSMAPSDRFHSTIIYNCRHLCYSILFYTTTKGHYELLSFIWLLLLPSCLFSTILYSMHVRLILTFPRRPEPRFWHEISSSIRHGLLRFGILFFLHLFSSKEQVLFIAIFIIELDLYIVKMFRHHQLRPVGKDKLNLHIYKWSSAPNRWPVSYFKVWQINQWCTKYVATL